MGVIGSLAVNVVANTGGLVKGLTRSRGLVKGFSATAAASMAGVAAAGALAVKSWNDVAPAIDATSKAARRLGVDSKSLSALGHAAQLSDVSTEALNKSLTLMLRNAAEAAVGLGESTAAFERLGISAAEVKNLNAEEAFLKIGDAINRLPTAADRTSVAMDIFGRSGASLLPLFEDGSEGIRLLMADAEKLGITFTAEQGRMVEAANDAMTRIGAATDGLKTQLVIALAPAVELVANDFADWVGSMNNAAKASGTAQSALGSLGSAIATVGDVVQGLQIGWKALNLMTLKTLDALSTGVETIGLQAFKVVNKLQGGGREREMRAEMLVAQASANRKLGIAEASKDLDNALIAPTASERMEKAARRAASAMPPPAAEAIGGNEPAKLQLEVPPQLESLLQNFGLMERPQLPAPAQSFFQGIGSGIVGAQDKMLGFAGAAGRGLGGLATGSPVDTRRASFAEMGSREAFFAVRAHQDRAADRAGSSANDVGKNTGKTVSLLEKILAAIKGDGGDSIGGGVTVRQYSLN